MHNFLMSLRIWLHSQGITQVDESAVVDQSLIIKSEEKTYRITCVEVHEENPQIEEVEFELLES